MISEMSLRDPGKYVFHSRLVTPSALTQLYRPFAINIPGQKII
jgi:hypothetical protein